MANRVTITIDVQDIGSPKIAKFANDASIRFEELARRGTDAIKRLQGTVSRFDATAAIANIDRFNAAAGRMQASLNNIDPRQVLTRLNQFANGAAASLASLGRAVTSAQSTFSSFGSNLKPAQLNTYASAVQKATTQTSSFGSSLNDVLRQAALYSPAFQIVGSAINGATGSITAGVASLVELDTQLRQVAAISPEVRGNFDNVRQAILDINPALGTSAELAKAFYDVNSAGLPTLSNTATQLDFVRRAAELARSGFTDAATATEVLISVTGAYGRQAASTATNVNTLLRGVEVGRFTFQQLASAIAPALPLASQLGVNLQQVVASVATLTTAGFSAAEATTGVASSFSNFIQKADAFRAIGVDVLGILQGGGGLPALFEALRKATGGNVEAIRRLVPDAQGLRAILALMGEQSELFASNLNKVSKESDALRVGFQQNQASISGAFNTLVASAERLFLAFAGNGDFVVSFFQQLSSTLQAITNSGAPQFLGATLVAAFNELSIGVFAAQKAVALFLEGLSAVGNFAGAVLSLIPGFTAVGQAITSVSTGLRQFAQDLRGAANQGIDESIRRLAQLAENYEKTGNAAGASGDKFRQASEQVASSSQSATAEVDKETAAMLRAVAAFDKRAEASAKAAKSSNDSAESTKNFGDRLTELVPKITAADKATESGRIAARRYAEEIIEAARKAGSEVPEGIQKIIDATIQAEQAGRSAQEAFRNVFEFSPAEGQRAIQDIIADFSNLGEAARTNADATRAAFDSATADIKAFFGGRLPPELQRLDEALRRNVDTFGTVEAAANRFGIATQEALGQAANSTLAAFDKMRASGKFTAEQLLEFFQRNVVEGFRAAGQALPADMEIVWKALQAQAATESRQLGLSVAEAARIAGIQTTAEFRRNVDQQVQALSALERSGQATYTQLLRAWEQVVEGFRQRGERIPAEFQATLARLTPLAAAEGARAGAALGTSLVNEFGQAIDTIEGRFQQVLGNVEAASRRITAFTEFEDDLSSLIDQFTEFQRTLNADSGYTAVNEHNRRETLEALDEIEGRIRDTFQTGVDEAIAFAEATGEAHIPDALFEGAQFLGVSFENIRAQIEAAAAGASRAADEFERVNAASSDVCQCPVTPSSGRAATVDGGETETSAAVRVTAEETQSAADRLRDIFSETGDDVLASGQTLQEVNQLLADSGVNAVDRLTALLDPLGFLGAASARLTDAQEATILAVAEGNALTNEQNLLLTEARAILVGNAEAAAAAHAAYTASTEATFAAASATGAATATTRSYTQAIATAASSASAASASFQAVAAEASGVASDLSQLRQDVAASNAVNTAGGTTGQSLRVGGGSGGSLLPRFQNGTVFAQQGQRVQLEAGEMVIPRAIAQTVRESLAGNSTGLTNPRGNVNVSSGSGNPNGASGFQFVPGMGTIPGYALAAATGRLDTHLGPQARRELQRTIVPTVQTALERRDLTRSVQRSTSLTRKGVPTLGGS